MARPRLYVIIAILNEEPNLPRLFETLDRLAEGVAAELDLWRLFVDDGSTDGGPALLEQEGRDKNLTVVRHQRNRGPGAAFASAFTHLAEVLEPGDWALTMEGDNTTPIATLLQMLTRRKEGYDVVLASPYAYGGGVVGVRLHRIFLGHAANVLAKSVLGLRGLHNLACFVRLYDGACLRRLQARYGSGIVEYRGFECMVEMLLKLVIIRARISEVEMVLDWRPREGKSKLRMLRAMWGYARLLGTGYLWRRRAADLWRPTWNE